MTDKQSALQQWVQCYFDEKGQASPTLEAIQGDAGFRQYYRVVNCQNIIPVGAQSEVKMLAVYGPPDIEKHESFVAIAEAYVAQGVRAPRVFAKDFDQGFLLIEDLGEGLLGEALDSSNVDSLYREGLETLLQIQRCEADESVFGLYSQQELRREMNLFVDWYVPKLLGLSLSDEEKSLIDETFITLENTALAQPQVVVHRDYHSRNIIYVPGSELGVIDFQDGVIGAITYDLVSLLRDCYVSWPQSKVEAWALDYARMAHRAGIIGEVEDKEFLKWFDFMGLQRHIKVLGIFARLSLRDGKDRYLSDLPLVIAYTRHVLAKYEELGAFHTWFEERLMPVARAGDWYSEVELPL